MSIDLGNGIIYDNNYETLYSVASRETIEIRSDCLYIRDYAFSGSKNTLKSFTFGSNPRLKEIGSHSFDGCTKLTAIDLKACTSLTTIKSYAFNGCSSVNNLILPTSIQTIEEYCFSSLFNLRITVQIPKSLTTMGDAVFYLTNITGIEFEPDAKITSIPWRALGKTNITNLTIPASVTNFESSSLEDTALYALEVEDGNKNYKVENKVLLSLDGTILYYIPGAFSDDDILPSTITTINNAAAQVKKLVLPDSTNEIGQYAIQGAPALESLTIHANVTTIGRNAFARCYYLREVIFLEPAKITSLPQEAFAWCYKLQSISIPSSVTEIGERCFFSCTSLTKIQLHNITTFGGGAFSSCGANLDIQFGSGSQFQFDTDNSLIITINGSVILQCLSSKETISIPENIVTIDNSAFYNIYTIKYIEIPENSKLSIIRSSAFMYCTGLISINLPESITLLEESCFAYCTQLAGEFNLPNIIEIHKNAFQNCINIESFNFPQIIHIKENAFSNCYGLKLFSCGQSLKTIGTEAFNMTTNLTQLNLPLSLEKISNKAFYYSGITTITFESDNMQNSLILSSEDSITEIGDEAFYYSHKLQNITLPNTIQRIGVGAFSYTALTTFTVPTSTTEIDNNCFEGCSSLTIFIISSSSELNSFGNSVFDKCFKLEEFKLYNNINFVLFNQGLFTHNYTKLIKFPPASTREVFTLPDQIEMITFGAFANCVHLKMIIIPEQQSFSIIGESAFENCTNLRTINIPDTVKTIHNNAFFGCNKIQCGQLISLNQTMKDILVKNAKFPRIGIKECENTIQICSCGQFHQTLFLVFLGLSTYV